jgi:hypothetical protein
MAGPLIADTGGLLRAIARRPDGRSAWPAYARALGTASRIVVAERLRIYRVLTMDHADFGPLRVGQRFTQRLEIVP